MSRFLFALALALAAPFSSAVGSEGPLAASAGNAAVSDPAATDPSEDMALIRALEETLVRRGTRVLPAGAVEIEPALSYRYAEVDLQRREAWGASLVTRVGLPWSSQFELELPYVIRDHWSGLGAASGLRDVGVGLSREMLAERDRRPSLVLSGRWWADTARRGTPALGSGTDAFQVELTASRRQDPVVLFGSASYTVFRPQDAMELGEVAGGAFGALLAATPESSLFFVIDAEASAASRFDGERIRGSDRLSGTAEFGITTLLARGFFLNVAAGTGLTPAAPDFFFVVSFPVRL